MNKLHSYSIIFCISLICQYATAQNLELFYSEYQNLVIKEKYALANIKLDSLLKSPLQKESVRLDVLLKKASLYSLLKVQDSALYYLEKTVETAKKSNNTDILNRANTNLGMLLNQIGRPIEALEHYKKHYQFVYALPNTKPNLRRRIIANYNIGLTFFKLEEIDSARNYLREGIKIANQIENYSAIAKLNGLLSEVNFSVGEDWEDQLFLAYQASMQTKDSIGLLKANLTAAEFYQASGDTQKAITFLEKAKLLIKKTPKNYSLWLNFHKLSANSFKYSKNYKESLQHLEDYLYKKEKLDSLTQTNAISIYNERLKIYEKDLENSKLLIKHKQKINDLTILSAVLGFLILISLSFFFIKYKLIGLNRKLFKINRLNENSLYTVNDKISKENRILYNKIQQKVDKEKLYLQHDINLSTLAKLVNSNSNYVSEAINLFTNTNFSTFINKKRIAHAKIKIVEQNKKQVLDYDDIAEISGFNSKSHFYRVFKQLSGLTPKQYLDFSKES